MNREDIIRMARDIWGQTAILPFDDIERFAQLVAAAEREAWRNAAIRVGENLATCGPVGYYDFTAKQWIDWALDATTKMQDDYMNFGACGEREACAKVCEELDSASYPYVVVFPDKCAAAIRARGQQ